MRGGPSSADVFDQVERVYACAETVTPGLPHLRRVGNTWGVVDSLSKYSTVHWPTPLWTRAKAYAWCHVMNTKAIVTCGECGAHSYGPA